MKAVSLLMVIIAVGVVAVTLYFIDYMAGVLGVPHQAVIGAMWLTGTSVGLMGR